jgi:hypothetical protein
VSGPDAARSCVGCSGAPRDLGLDQGVALRVAVRREAAQLPWRARIEAALGGAGADRLSERVDRDLRRHFPHMAERQAGLARGAGVRPGELSALLARELYTASAPGPAASQGLLAALAPTDGGPAIVGRTLPEADVVTRNSAPDHDYASREVVLPWLVPALGGRNERGLCVVGASQPCEGVPEAGGAAPALLLVQDCLQRFDSTEKAIEWCQGRPAGGRAALLIADAEGDVAAMEIDRDVRNVRRATDGLLVVARTAAEADALRKAVLEAAGDRSQALREALAAGGEPVTVLEARIPDPD